MATKPITFKRAAIVNELAGMGITQAQMAILCDVSSADITYLKRKFGIDVKEAARGAPSWLQDRIIRNFPHGLAVSVMAERFGTSESSIRVTMCRLRKAGKLPARSAQ